MTMQLDRPELAPVEAPARVRFTLNWRSIKNDLSGIRTLKATKYGLTPIVVLTFVQFAQSFDTSIFDLLRPDIRRDLDISIATLGYITTITGFVGLLIAPLVGYLADRRNRVRMMSISTLVSGVFALFTAQARTVGQVFGARTADNVSEDFGTAPLALLTYDYYPVEARGKMVAFTSTVGKLLGFTIGPLVGGLAVLGGWRLPFYLAGPLLLAAGVLALRTLREPIRGYWERKHLGAGEEVASEPDPPVGMGEAVRSVLAIRTLRRFVVAHAVGAIFTPAFAFLMTFYLADHFRLNAFQRSLVQIPSGVVSMIGVIVGGALADVLVRYRPSRLLLLNGLLGLAGAVSVLVQVLAPSVWLLIGSRVVFAFLGGLVAPASTVVFAHVLPPRLRGFGVSVVFLPIAFVGNLGPSLAGQVEASYGLRGGMLFLFPLTLIGPLIALSAAKFFEVDMRAALASAMAKEEYRRAKAAGATKLLVCKDVDVSYGSVQVLFNVDLVVEEGEIVALLGTNGAGKSTILRAVAGTQEASNGAVLFDGRDITHLPPHEISRLGVVSMPGGKGTFPGLTVGENLDLALWNCPAAEQEARRQRLFELFPVLRDRLDQDAALLSGGEQQMVALGQAFLAQPRLLMIDELSLGLAPAVVASLLDAVRAVRDQGTTVILVEQSVNVALTVAERAVFMEKGEVKFEGPTADLLARPDLMRAVYVKGARASHSSPPGPRPAAGPGSGRAVLEAAHLGKSYGGKRVLDDVSFSLTEGSALGFIGPNGAGKTTLFDLLSGYQSPDAGTITLEGVDITNLSPDGRARAKLIRRFQDARLFPSLTVFETLCVALDATLDIRNTMVIATQAPPVRRSERRVRLAADRLVELFELGTYRDKFVADLSTGLRRVVDLACVLAAEPKVLLLDEPSSGIAQAEAETLGPMLRRVRHETGCSLLIIEHDVLLIRAVADELVGLVQGSIIVQGAADDVLGHPTIVAAYLGDDQATIERQGEAR
ncbi:MAG TPA: MFS transporter [Acidimicrobiales bacterium]|nr:MFS transporter [Acidimicrobiales bacterium]